MMKIPWLSIALSCGLFCVTEPLSAAEITFDWSGHLRASGVLDYYGEDNLLALTAGNRLLSNATFDGRLNYSLYWGERTSFNLGYEVVANGGQTRETITELAGQNPGFEQSSLYRSRIPSDENQLFDLTKIISEGDDYILYQRLDRLFFASDSAIGNISIGRQALTWGNGLLFNPADLINPFAPSDIIRDYKIGSDMVLYQNGFRIFSDLQVVIVPRTGEDNELDSDQSTYGLKSRFSGGPGDLDLYLMENYQDPVLGAGFSTYLGDGVLRSDVTWTYLEEDTEPASFVSGILNYDYSWVWSGHNWYGFIEFYYNGLGDSDPLEALHNIPLRERLERGEIFVTGKYYVDAMVHYEAHPLINLFATLIYNLEDQSFLLQPRLNWDLSQSAELLLGVNIPVGSEGSEFGELRDPEDGAELGQPTQAYLVATFFF